MASNIKELRDSINAQITESNRKKQTLKQRTEALVTDLKKAADELSQISDDYRELLESQNDMLRTAHTKLADFEGLGNWDINRSYEKEGKVLSPTQVESSESFATASNRCYQASHLDGYTELQDERMRMQENKPQVPSHDHHNIRRVYYREIKRRKNQSELSGLSSSSPLLADEKSIPPVSKQVPSRVINEYEISEADSNKRQFNCPYQLANGPGNELIISDMDNHQLVVFDSLLQSSFTYGDRGLGEGTFYHPTGLAVDTVGSHLYVADHNNSIQKFEINYTETIGFSLQFKYVESYGGKGNEEGKLHCPCGMCLSKTGLGLFVCDLNNHRIQIFNGDGNVSGVFGKRGEGPGEFDQPHSIAINSNEDKIFVSDYNNHRVQVFLSQGDHRVIQVIVDNTNAPSKPQMRYPRGICCTNSRHLLVSSTHTNCILEFDEDGPYQSTIEGIDQPAGIILFHTEQIVVISGAKKGLVVLN